MSNSFVYLNENNELHKFNMNITSNETNLTFDNNLLINGNLNFSGDITKNGNPLVSSLWTEDSSNISYTAGKVSIGNLVNTDLATNNTTEKLHIQGNLKIGGQNTFERLTAGNLDIHANTCDFYVASGQHQCFHNGGTQNFAISPERIEVKNSCLKVVTTGNTGTAGRPSSQQEGDLRYNSDYKCYEFFDGDSWSLMLSLSATNVGPGGAGGWTVLMKTGGHKSGSWFTAADFGDIGTSAWKSLSVSTANGRTGIGEGNGVYEGFFTQKYITHIALVSDNGPGGLNNPYMHHNYVIYDLVESTGNESIYDILKRLNQTALDLNVSTLADVGTGYDNPSSTNFTGGINGYSGLKTHQKGSWPDVDKFVIWGINHDSDNDAQILCAYSGNLQSGKGDSWRNPNPSQTFWSYWGCDWNVGSASRTISVIKQSDPGISTTHTDLATTDIYLLAYSNIV